MSKKSVYVAYTGGTIGMRRDAAGGYRPEPGFLARQMAEMNLLRRDGMPSFSIHEYEPLLDSAEMSPADWVKIGEDIAAHYDDYDGFIVLHGTDTMAYSASALSFMLENLSKPVVFTGSQIPLMELRTDARENLVTSLLIAAEGPIPEVSLFAGTRLLRGNRATKISSAGFLAFASPNYPPLGEAGVDLDLRLERIRRQPRGRFRLHRVGGAQVADLRLFPGITVEMLERFLQPPLEGAVLHTYGVGNAPSNPSFLRPLQDASARGVVIVNCSQCLEGRVDMDDYATGRALRDAGVISGFDMTPEAALTKLYFLLSLGLDVDAVRLRMQEDLRGELSPSPG